MLILTKRKIVYVIGTITVLMFAYLFICKNVIKNNKMELDSIQTVALPINNKVIVLDAGHGIPDERC